MVDVHLVNSWDRLGNETSREYERFEYYRRQQGRRSIRRAYIEYLVATIGQEEVDRRQAISPYAMTGYPTNWGTMAKRNRWAERASAFDAHQHDLDMAIETEERDQCRELRRSALRKLLTAGTDALEEIDLSTANLAQASTAVKTAVRELRTEYHDHDTQVEVSAMLAIIPNELRQGILAMLQIKASGPLALPPPDDNDNDNDITDDNDT